MGEKEGKKSVFTNSTFPDCQGMKKEEEQGGKEKTDGGKKEGRKGGREGEREGGREGGRKGEREGGREGIRERGREIGGKGKVWERREGMAEAHIHMYMTVLAKNN